MGLIRSNMVEAVEGATDLSLEAPARKGFIIRNILYDNIADTDEDVKVSVERKNIFHFKFPGEMFLLGRDTAAGQFSILQALMSAGYDLKIPIAEGQTLDIKTPAASSYLEVIYDEYDAADVDERQHNGAAASSYDLFQVISNSGVTGVAADLDLDQSDLDSEFPAFPGGKLVPAGYSMKLKALFGCPVTKGNGSNNGQHTTHLKLIREREDILDRNQLGTFFHGDIGHTANTVVYVHDAGRLWAGHADNPPGVIWFDNPINFTEGQELNVKATIAETTAGIDLAAAEVKLGLLFEVHTGQ